MVPLLLIVAAIGAGRAGDRRRGGARHARSPARESDLAAAARRREARRARGRALILALVLWLALVVGVAGRRHGRLGRAPRRRNGERSTARVRVRRDRLSSGAATGRPRGRDRGSARPAPSPPTWSTRSPALVDFLEPVQKASPFYHYVASDPLRHGPVAPATSLFLLGVAAAASALAARPLRAARPCCITPVDRHSVVLAPSAAKRRGDLGHEQRLLQ